MADILIKGMEMPKNCIDCMFTTIDYDMCILAKNDLMLCGCRPSWCPLVPLPEGHGRLIDADALIDALETQDYSCAPDTLEDWTPQDMTAAEIADITHAPTIVPAEGGGE